ncbi:MAG: hypothetical protein K0Q57_1240 [Gammaproteobacteria bacterium]|jgi:hypothetical protein|nr:hypothetical protein [Gammaproteobacteria bacterium]
MTKFTIEQITDAIEVWLIKGDLNCAILADDFSFHSPFWKNSNKAEFFEKFVHSEDYKNKSLAKIVKFDPIIKFASLDQQCFSIILQYHTKNGSSVYEAVLGMVDNGLLVELRSIYDLEATKKALEL